MTDSGIYQHNTIVIGEIRREVADQQGRRREFDRMTPAERENILRCATARAMEFREVHTHIITPGDVLFIAQFINGALGIVTTVDELYGLLFNAYSAEPLLQTDDCVSGAMNAIYKAYHARLN